MPKTKGRGEGTWERPQKSLYNYASASLGGLLLPLLLAEVPAAWGGRGAAFPGRAGQLPSTRLLITVQGLAGSYYVAASLLQAK